jgi:hypothetical protein
MVDYQRARSLNTQNGDHLMSRSFLSTSYIKNGLVTGILQGSGSAYMDKQELTKNLIIKRKTDLRLQKMRNIDEQNMKIFKNLSNVKSSISRQNLERH